MKATKKIKSAALSLCLFVVSVSACLILVEVFLEGRSIAKREKMLAQENTGECSTVAENKQLIYTFVPNKCGHNSKGYRDYEYSYIKDHNVFRIVVIGDSVAQGQGVDISQSFPKVLEKKLNALISDEERKVQVITLARSGYTTYQELIILEKEAFLYYPDLILWSYVLNDPAHPYYDIGNPMGMYYFQPDFYTVDFVREAFVKIRERLMKRDCDTRYYAFVHCVYWRKVESNMEKIANMTSERGIPVILLIHPIFDESVDFSSYPFTPLHKQLVKSASDHGIEVLDLIQPYLSYDPVELAQSKRSGMIDSLHPNRLGHEVAANYIFRSVREDETFGDWVGKN